MSNEKECTLSIKSHEIFENSNNFESYLTYYKALVNWIDHNIHRFSEDIKEKSRLNVLLFLDAEKYMVKVPEISLELEKKRIGLRKYRNAKELAMTVGDTLWDLVTIRSGKDCPNCIHDELRYIITVDKITKKRELLLECESCAWLEDIYGKKPNNKECIVYPARMEEIREVDGWNAICLETYMYGVEQGKSLR